MKSFLKKATSLIVGASLAFSLICAPASAEIFTDGECTVTDYTSYSAQEYAMSYLRMLGISDGIEPAQNVTRGQAVSTIVRALGGESAAISLSGSMYTYDEKMAAYAYNCGILSGSTPSEWQLDSLVTGAQLSKMLVVALGYGAIITSPNAYPAEYLRYAVKAGLTKGVTNIGNDLVSGGDFAIMIMNALDADIVEVVGVTDDEAIYEISDDATLESLYLQKKNLAKGEGIVEADFYTSIVADSRCEFSRIRIEGLLYACQSENLKGLVGSRIEFVYADEKSEAKRVIVGTRLTEENKIYEFASGHGAYYEGGELRYEVAGDKEDKILLGENAVYVVNNMLLSSYDMKNVEFSQYIIKAIDNNDDSRCDVVFLTKSVSMIVKYVKDDIIYLSYGTLNSKNVIDLSDYKADTDALIIRDVSGTPKALSDIAENSSISVIASDDLGFVEIIILTDPIEGKFEEYNNTANTVLVNGVLYGLKNLNADFVLGNIYSMRINENNEIFYIESIMSDCSYVVDVSNMSQGLTTDVKIKLYDNVNGIQVYSAAERVTVDGTSYSDPQSISAAVTKRTLAYVSINAKCEISKIDYLGKYGETAKRIYRSAASGFNDITLAESLPFRFDDNTVFFYVPKSGDDMDFGLYVPMKNKDEYTTQGYELNEDTGFVKAVVVEVDSDMRTDNYISYSSDVGVVSSVTSVLDPDGQGVYKIEGFHDGEAFVYTSGHYDDVFSVCNTLKAGDVIRYIANYNNEIVRIQKTISLSDNLEFFHDGKDTVDERFYGQVITLSKNLLTNYSEYLSHEMNVSMNSSYNDLSFMRFPALLVNPSDTKYQFSNYYCYDKKSKEVSVACIDDIISAEMAGDAASNVFVQRSKSDVQCIVIVKE